MHWLIIDMCNILVGINRRKQPVDYSGLLLFALYSVIHHTCIWQGILSIWAGMQENMSYDMPVQ